MTEDAELGVTFVRGPGSGPDLTYAAMPRGDDRTWAEAILREVEKRLEAEHAARGKAEQFAVLKAYLLPISGNEGYPGVAGRFQRAALIDMSVAIDQEVFVGRGRVHAHLVARSSADGAGEAFAQEGADSRLIGRA